MLVIRAFLTFVFLLLLLVGGIYEIASAIELGEARAPLRRWSGLVFTYREQPFGYAVAIGLWAAGVGGFAWLAIRQIRALIRPSRRDNVAMFHAQGRELEKLNPTGFRPLWIALAIAGFIVAYALATV